MLPRINDSKEELKGQIIIPNSQGGLPNSEIRFIPVIIPYPVFFEAKKNTDENNGNEIPDKKRKKEENIINKTIKKSKKKKKKVSPLTKRTSAAKKYVGQICNGLARYIMRLRNDMADECENELREFTKKNFLGKQDQAYKISKTSDFFKIISYSEGDLPKKKELANRLKLRTLEFFQDPNFKYWLKNEFKGVERGKLWLLLNKERIRERLMENKMVNFETVEDFSNEVISEKLRTLL